MKNKTLKCTFKLLLLLLVNGVFAQSQIEYKGEIINRLDANDNQIGLWKLHDDNTNTMISVLFDDEGFAISTDYYNNGKHIASYKNDLLEIYKDSKTITAEWFRRPDNSRTLVDKKGKELDSETIRYFSRTGEVRAMFYGGNERLFAFIGDSIDYKAIGKNTGLVKVRFTIDGKGFPSDIEILDSTNTALNDEAKRIVSILPRWQPAHQACSFVKMQYVLPINIK